MASNQAGTPGAIAPQFIHIGRIAPSLTWGMSEHSHSNFHELIVVVQGKLETQIQGKTIHGVPGNALFYPQTVPHAERAVGTVPLETIFFSFHEPIEQAQQRLLLGRDPQGRILALSRWILELSPTGNPETKQMLNEMFRAILFEYSAQSEVQESECVRRVKEFVRQHLAEELTLDDLAQSAHISKHHFARVFKSHTGLSPMAYLRRARVEAARTILLSSSKPLKTIAREVGLGDEFHLSRVFRKVTGQPPTALRKNR